MSQLEEGAKLEQLKAEKRDLLWESPGKWTPRLRFFLSDRQTGRQPTHVNGLVSVTWLE